MSSSFFLVGSKLKKTFLGKWTFSRRIRLDWGNTARVDMAGLESISKLSGDININRNISGQRKI